MFWNILGSVAMKIFLFFLDGNNNCRVSTKQKQTGPVVLAETQVILF